MTPAEEAHMTTRIEAVELRRGQRVWLDGHVAPIARVRHDPDRAVVMAESTDERIIICRASELLTLDDDAPG